MRERSHIQLWLYCKSIHFLGTSQAFCSYSVSVPLLSHSAPISSTSGLFNSPPAQLHSAPIHLSSSLLLFRSDQISSAPFLLRSHPCRLYSLPILLISTPFLIGSSPPHLKSIPLLIYSFPIPFGSCPSPLSSDLLHFFSSQMNLPFPELCHWPIPLSFP